jgi:hypothetical protein
VDENTLAYRSSALFGTQPANPRRSSVSYQTRIATEYRHGELVPYEQPESRK